MSHNFHYISDATFDTLAFIPFPMMHDLTIGVLPAFIKLNEVLNFVNYGFSLKRAKIMFHDIVPKCCQENYQLQINDVIDRRRRRLSAW